jgi:predicted component of type VI protein secretion system
MLRDSNFPASRQEARDSGSGGLGDFLVLEISRGRTQHPLRPVSSKRFLIGSSERCDLRLGDPEIPALHTLIVVDGGHIWLETLAPLPAVELNGRPVTSVRLNDGDQIRIGSFELVAHVSAPPVNSDASPPQSPVPVSEIAAVDQIEEVVEPEASSLSAADLVERIEAATQLVNEFERRQRLGIEALLESIDRQDGLAEAASADPSRGTVLPMSEVADESSNPSLDDIESLVSELSEVLGQLEKRLVAQQRRQAG